MSYLEDESAQDITTDVAEKKKIRYMILIIDKKKMFYNCKRMSVCMFEFPKNSAFCVFCLFWTSFFFIYKISASKMALLAWNTKIKWIWLFNIYYIIKWIIFVFLVVIMYIAVYNSKWYPLSPFFFNIPWSTYFQEMINCMFFTEKRIWF